MRPPKATLLLLALVALLGAACGDGDDANQAVVDTGTPADDEREVEAFTLTGVVVDVLSVGREVTFPGEDSPATETPTDEAATDTAPPQDDAGEAVAPVTAIAVRVTDTESMPDTCIVDEDEVLPIVLPAGTVFGGIEPASATVLDNRRVTIEGNVTVVEGSCVFAALSVRDADATGTATATTTATATATATRTATRTASPTGSPTTTETASP